jgi:hypothetical protein
MRTERSHMRKREMDQCVSEISTNENREKSHEEEGKRSLCTVRLGPVRTERSPLRI